MITRKYKSIYILLAFALLLTACQAEPNYTKSSKPKQTETTTIIESSSGNVIIQGEDNSELKEFLEKRSDFFASPVREYGREQIVNVNSGKFLAHIAYPEGGLGQLDQICKDWAEGILELYREESKYDNGELVLTYNSRIIDNKYVVVEFDGEYNNEYYANPVSLLATFNANINTGDVLNLSDILEQKQIDKLTQYVLEINDLSVEQVDDELLNKWQCADGGIKVTLPKGKYLAANAGDSAVFASYDFLAGLAENITESTIEIASLETTEAAAESTESIENTSDSETAESSEVASSSENASAENGEQEAKYLALTFDDGPGDDTARLLDILAENNVKATFFVLGSRIDSNPELLPRMIAEGHEIGGHSWTHRSFTSLNNEELTNEIMQTRAKIFALTEVDSLAVRPPYGAFNDRVRAVAKDLGVYFVNWNVDPVDWKTRNAQMTYDGIVNTAANGNIILTHDIHSSTVDAMSLVIPKLLSEGYQFVTVKELLIMGFGEPEAGSVYYSIDVKR